MSRRDRLGDLSGSAASNRRHTQQQHTIQLLHWCLERCMQASIERALHFLCAWCCLVASTCHQPLYCFQGNACCFASSVANASCALLFAHSAWPPITTCVATPAHQVEAA